MKHRFSILLLLILVGMVLILVPAKRTWADGCSPTAIQNSGFETNTGWQILPDPRRPEYAINPVHSGMQSMRLGIIEDSNAVSHSAVQQQIVVPTGGTSTLHWWVYTVSEPNAGNDHQKLLLLKPNGAVLATPWDETGNARSWQEKTTDLTPFAGQQVILYFVVDNDGSGGRTGMYLDDVQLFFCPNTPVPTNTPTATPTGTPVPTPTPGPTATPTATFTATPTPTVTPTWTPVPPTPTSARCQDLVYNGDFEQNDGWTVGKDMILPYFMSDQLGNMSRFVCLGCRQQDPASYSSIRQQVHVPDWAVRLWLCFRYYPVASNPGGVVNAYTDRQEVMLLDASGHAPIGPNYLWRFRESSNRWETKNYLIDMGNLGVQDFWVYFNVFNDGIDGKTRMYLDDVHLIACSGGAHPADLCPSPAPTSPPPPTHTPYPVPTSTSVAPTHTPYPVPTSTPHGATGTPQPVTVTPTGAISGAAAGVRPLPRPTATPTPSLPSFGISDVADFLNANLVPVIIGFVLVIFVLGSALFYLVKRGTG